MNRQLNQDVPPLFMGKYLSQARDEGHLLAEPDYEQLKFAMWDTYQNHLKYKYYA